MGVVLGDMHTTIRKDTPSSAAYARDSVRQCSPSVRVDAFDGLICDVDALATGIRQSFSCCDQRGGDSRRLMRSRLSPFVARAMFVPGYL
jgi:hypothetical protein